MRPRLLKASANTKKKERKIRNPNETDIAASVSQRRISISERATVVSIFNQNQQPLNYRGSFPALRPGIGECAGCLQNPTHGLGPFAISSQESTHA